MEPEWATYCSLARHGMVRAQSGLRKHSIQIVTIGLIEADQSGSKEFCTKSTWNGSKQTAISRTEIPLARLSKAK